MGCLLCRIVARTEEASIVYEDDRVVAICDLYPVNPGHLLVITKAHAVGLGDLSATDGCQMFAVAQRLAAALRKTDLRCEGINLFLADGEAASRPSGRTNASCPHAPGDALAGVQPEP